MTPEQLSEILVRGEKATREPILRRDIVELVVEVRKSWREFGVLHEHYKQLQQILRLCMGLKEKYRKQAAPLKQANAELVQVATEARTSLLITVSNIRSEMKRDAIAASRWEGVPEELEKRMADIDASIAKHGDAK